MGEEYRVYKNTEKTYHDRITLRKGEDETGKYLGIVVQHLPTGDEDFLDAFYKEKATSVTLTDPENNSITISVPEFVEAVRNLIAEKSLA